MELEQHIQVPPQVLEGIAIQAPASVSEFRFPSILILQVFSVAYVVMFFALFWINRKKFSSQAKKQEKKEKSHLELVDEIEDNARVLNDKIRKLPFARMPTGERFAKLETEIKGLNIALTNLYSTYSSTGPTEKELKDKLTEDQEEIKQLKLKIEKMKEEMTKKSKKHDELKEANGTLVTDIEQLKRQINVQSTRADEAERHLTQAQKESDDGEIQAGKLENLVKRARREVEDLTNNVQQKQQSLDDLRKLSKLEELQRSLDGESTNGLFDLSSAVQGLSSFSFDPHFSSETGGAINFDDFNLEDGDSRPLVRLTLPDAPKRGILSSSNSSDKSDKSDKSFRRKVSWGDAPPAGAELSPSSSGSNPFSSIFATASSSEFAKKDDDSITCGLLKDWGVKADENKKKRSRKSVSLASRSASSSSSGGMEDENFVGMSFGDDENRALFVVLDGHVGKDAATFAKDALPASIAQEIGSKTTSITDVSKQLVAAFQDCDDKMRSFDCVGCTATAVLLWQIDGVRYLQAANVGDSTAFICRNGVAEQLTIDHKVTNPLERERMRAMGVQINDTQQRISGLGVSRALGDRFLKDNNTGVIGVPHISSLIQLAPTDSALILASDGLWDVMSGSDAFEMISGYEVAQDAANRLLNQALSTSTCTDNVTIIVVLL